MSNWNKTLAQLCAELRRPHDDLAYEAKVDLAVWLERPAFIRNREEGSKRHTKALKDAVQLHEERADIIEREFVRWLPLVITQAASEPRVMLLVAAA